MKILKVLVLIVGVLFITGCSVDYNILIGKDMVVEEAIITAYEDDTTSKKELFVNYKDEYPIYIDQEFMYYKPYDKREDYTYYNKSYTELENGYIFKYSSEYSKDKILLARSINTLFESKMSGYNEDDNYYYLAFNKPLLFNGNSQVDSVRINISFTSDIVVLSTNCYSYDNGVYTWVVNNKNFNGINIKYTIPGEEKPDVKPEPKKVEEKTWAQENFWLIIGGAFILLLIVIGVAAKISSRKR